MVRENEKELSKSYQMDTCDMLALNFIFSLLIAGVNPEAWFFGHKLGGTEATCWLITNGFAGVIMQSLLCGDGNMICWQHSFSSRWIS